MSEKDKPTLRPSGFRVSFGTLGIATLAIALMELVLPITTLQVYDRVLPNASPGTLTILLSMAAVALVADFALRLARAHLIGASGCAFQHSLSRQAIERLLRADTSRMPKRGTGETMNAIASIRSLKDFNNGYGYTTAMELVFIPIVIALIAIIGGYLALAPVLLLIAFCVLSLRNGALLRAATARRNKLDDKRYDFMIDNLGAAHTIKALSLENRLTRSYEAMKHASCIENHSVSLALTNIFDTAALFSSLIIYSTVAIGAAMALNGQLSPGELIACMLLSGRLMQPVQRGLSLYARRQDCLTAKAQVDELLSTPSVRESDTALLNYGESGDQNLNRGQLKLENISFAFGDGREVLKDVSLELKAGEMIGLGGPQGAGRTTLLKVIAGIYPPSSGSVLVNGRNPLETAPELLSRQIGLMPSRGVIYRGTILDNMSRFGETPIQDVLYVARLLKVDEDVSQLPGGLETQLEGNGSDPIPPGLKQRIALVRSLATKPRLVLFDNADQTLDRVSYFAVYKLLAQIRQKAAIIIVSDDAYLLGLANRKIELKEGQLFEGEATGDSMKVRRYRELRV